MRVLCMYCVLCGSFSGAVAVDGVESTSDSPTVEQAPPAGHPAVAAAEGAQTLPCIPALTPLIRLSLFGGNEDLVIFYCIHVVPSVKTVGFSAKATMEVNSF